VEHQTEFPRKNVEFPSFDPSTTTHRKALGGRNAISPLEEMSVHKTAQNQKEFIIWLTLLNKRIIF
jgi:hypothetical protein